MYEDISQYPVGLLCSAFAISCLPKFQRSSKMDSHFVFALLMVCLSIAVIDAKTQKHTVKIVEGGQIVKEKVLVDVKAGFEYFYVPAHGQIDAIITIFDYNKGLVLTKFVKRNACYLRRLERADTPPAALENGLEKSNLKKAWKTYVTENENDVVLRRATPKEMESKAFQKICGNIKVNFVIRAPASKKAMERLMNKFVRGGNSDKAKRSVTIRDVVSCSSSSTREMFRCYMKDRNGRGISAICKFKRSGCIYKAICNFFDHKVICNDAQQLSNFWCCDYKCNL